MREEHTDVCISVEREGGNLERERARSCRRFEGEIRICDVGTMTASQTHDGGERERCVDILKSFS